LFQNIISGIIGAVVGGVLLYFLVGIPGDVQRLDSRVSHLEGRFQTFIDLREEFNALQDRVKLVEKEISTLKGKSDEWGSGWVDFDEQIDFKKGDSLIIKVGGTAIRVLVRLLPVGKLPGVPVGVLSKQFEVPANRELMVELQEDHEAVTQVSVHGGPNPFGKYSLGPQNGPAFIEELDIKRR